MLMRCLDNETPTGKNVVDSLTDKILRTHRCGLGTYPTITRCFTIIITDILLPYINSLILQTEFSQKY